MMKTPHLFAFVLWFGITSTTCQASRTIFYSQAYGARCPSDRTGAVITVTNIAKVKQTVQVIGTQVVQGGDGACFQSYASLGLTQNTVIANASFYSVYSGSLLAGGWVSLNPGGMAEYLIASGVSAGGTGNFSGSITVKEDAGAVIASGLVNNPQDSAQPPAGATLGNQNYGPNYNIAYTMVINGALPF